MTDEAWITHFVSTVVRQQMKTSVTNRLVTRQVEDNIVDRVVEPIGVVYAPSGRLITSILNLIRFE